MKKGDIYLVEFPFSDISNSKKRPALVIGELKGENTIFCQISTSQKLTKEYKIELNKKEVKGEITFNSFIYVDMIFTLHKDLVVRKLGSIPLEKMKEVNSKILSLFNL